MGREGGREGGSSSSPGSRCPGDRLASPRPGRASPEGEEAEPALLPSLPPFRFRPASQSASSARPGGGKREREREGRKGRKEEAPEAPRSRRHDGGQEQQDAAAHRLPHAVHPAGRARLHRHLQGLRQAHEPHPLRLRRVPQDQAQELQAAGAGGEARPGPGAAARGEPRLHDRRRAAPQGHWHCSRATGRCSRRTRCRQSGWERSACRSSHAPGASWFGWPCPWSRGTIPTGHDSSESGDSCSSSSCRHRQHCRSPHAVCTGPWRATASHGQGDSSSWNDGASSWHETSHGSTDGHATWPRLTNGHASSWDETASPGHERAPSTRHAPTQALRPAATQVGSAPAGVGGWVGWVKGIIHVYMFSVLWL